MSDLNPTAASLLGFLLGGEPRSGWELARAAERSIGNFWNLTRSQVYRELRDLADRGLVTAGEVGPRDRVPYRVTPAGRDAFREWIEGEPGPAIIRNRLLLTVFFADHLPPGRLAEVLEAHRAQHVAVLDQYEALAPHLAPGPVAATLAFGLAYERMVLAWIDDTAAQLT
jgi:DNA-binding PadR family transcriptional regulator